MSNNIQEANPAPKHSHYFREWKGEKLDFYFIMTLFGITDPCIAHALKKLMFAGVRGAKGEEKDLNEAIDSIRRRLELMKAFEMEEAGKVMVLSGNLGAQPSSSFKAKTDGFGIPESVTTSGGAASITTTSTLLR